MTLIGYFAVFLCAVLAVYGQSGITTDTSEVTATPNPEISTRVTEPPVTTPVTEPPVTTPATEPPVTTPATEPPVTTPATEPPTTTPATEPPTTTPATEPPTTTPATEPPTTTPGTEPPTTTSGTEPPTTTPAPASEDLNLYVNNSGSFCILMNMEITLTVQYENATGANVTNSHTLHAGDVIVDKDRSSNCSNADSQSEEHLFAFIQGQNELYVRFNQADKKVSINQLRLTFADLRSIFEDAKPNNNITLMSNQKLFEYSSSKSYKCDAASKVDLLDENNQTTNSFVTFKEVKVQAFGTTGDASFASAEDCVQDDNVSDIVPIAVGCALAALVVIVLIAYLVGRRQKRQRGYESV